MAAALVAAVEAGLIGCGGIMEVHPGTAVEEFRDWFCWHLLRRAAMTSSCEGLPVGPPRDDDDDDVDEGARLVFLLAGSSRCDD